MILLVGFVFDAALAGALETSRGLSIGAGVLLGDHLTVDWHLSNLVILHHGHWRWLLDEKGRFDVIGRLVRVFNLFFFVT